MLRLLSSEAQECNNFSKPSKPYHVGINLKALPEYSQMSTHVPGFQSYFSVFFASFCIGKVSHQQHKGKGWIPLNIALLVEWWLILLIQNDTKKMKND